MKDVVVGGGGGGYWWCLGSIGSRRIPPTVNGLCKGIGGSIDEGIASLDDGPLNDTGVPPTPPARLLVELVEEPDWFLSGLEVEVLGEDVVGDVAEHAVVGSTYIFTP